MKKRKKQQKKQQQNFSNFFECSAASTGHMVFKTIQDGPFRGCSRMGGKKGHSLKSVTHIMQ